jgi:GNAT superfamily N-acetyltransferase
MSTSETPTLIRIDTADDAALGRWLAVRNEVDPRQVSMAAFRAETAAVIDHLELLAVLDGQDVGASAAGWSAISLESKTAFIEIWVLPTARRRGIGTTLMDRSVAFALEHGLETARSSALEGDADALRFAVRHGLRVVGSGQLGDLDLTTPPVAPSDPPPGVRLASFADRPDLERAVYDLDVLVMPEIPTLALEPAPSFEAWQQSASGDPGFLAGQSLMALRDGALVGVIQVYDNGDQSMFIGMTAVHPAARRLGIARYLKTELASRAARAGFTRIETFNDGTNERMRALNIDLGYVYQPRLVGLKGPLR